ncbi:MAG TPA: hypothetical protein VL357_03185 [Rariglobus sp.]|jgi:hypothetical protein|nr:hypothetical protein [Rariglobus sp.]
MSAARQKHLGPLDFSGGPNAPKPGSGMKALEAAAISKPAGSFYYPLFEHMSREHGLILTDSELAEIVRVSEALSRNDAGGPCGPQAAPVGTPREHP